jgi:hypothetical protein
VLCELSNGDGVSVSESRGIIYMSYRGSKDRRVTFICKCVRWARDWHGVYSG